MAILRIKSSNENLSYIISKNPNSGLFVKKHKQGMFFGYFPIMEGETNCKEYYLHFKDASDNISYKEHVKQQFEYLNSSKYNDARFINDVIQDCLHGVREGKTKEYDIPSNYLIEINLVNTEFRTVDIFRKYFPNIEIRLEEISKNNFNIIFINDIPMTLQYMLRVINLFGIFAQLNSPTYSYFTEDLVKKYIRIANEVDAPYFIKYLIKTKMCTSETIFNNNKLDLETSSKYIIDMKFSDTHAARIQWIKDLIGEPKYSIIDIGTGRDYKYLKLLAPLLKEKGLMYYAIEIDSEAREHIKAGLRNRNLEDTVVIFSSLNEFIEFYKKYHTDEKIANRFNSNEKFDVICTEVLEHNEFKEANKIVNIVYNNIYYNQFIVTVPNIEFNQFYCLEGFRHPDHKFECTFLQLFSLFFHKNERLIGYSNIHPVGDTIKLNEEIIPVTWGITLFK